MAVVPLGSLRRGNEVIMVKCLMFHLAFSLNNGKKLWFSASHFEKRSICFHSFMTFSYTARAEKEFTQEHQPIRKRKMQLAIGSNSRASRKKNSRERIPFRYIPRALKPFKTQSRGFQQLAWLITRVNFFLFLFINACFMSPNFRNCGPLILFSVPA